MGRADPSPPGGFARVQRPAEGKGSAGTRTTDSGSADVIRLPPTGANGSGGTYQPATGNYGHGEMNSPRPRPPTGASGVPEDSED